MSSDLELEAKQLEKSIADAKAAGQTFRAEKLTDRRKRVLARIAQDAQPAQPDFDPDLT